MIELTLHGQKRLKERCGDFNNSNVGVKLKKIYDNGKQIENCPKELRKYLTNVLQASVGDTLRVFGNQVYLFGHQKLITAFAIPNKIIQKASRTRESNYEQF